MISRFPDGRGGAPIPDIVVSKGSVSNDNTGGEGSRLGDVGNEVITADDIAYVMDDGLTSYSGDDATPNTSHSSVINAGGGTWFRVVERNGLDHLVRERQIIRSARQEWAEAQGEESNGIAPLLFAGMIIEGGIIGYDTNLKTGGRGARTLGIGFSKQYRQDAITVSIRAVSVLTGEVLLNVQSRKTILSYGSGGDVFRFIEEGTQLVEIEDGVGNNESVTYATRSAIEAGVLEIIYQGHDRGFWKIKGYNENE